MRGICRILVMLAGLFSAAAALAAPDWISGNPAKYPGSMYLIGRGAGSTEAEAQDRARGDLATIFEVHINMTTENTTTVVSSGNDEQVRKLASQQVSARTDKVINGINIAEIWRDPQTMEYHALAVLPRSQAAAGLRDEIGNLDDGMQMDMDAAKAADDPLLKLAALNRALDSSVNRDGFQSLLKVIDPSGQGIEPPVPRSAVQAQINAALQRIRIVPEVAGDSDAAGEFAAILKGGLAAAGFLAQDGDNTDFVLMGKLTLNDAIRQSNWYWMLGTVEVSLVEKKSGRVRGSKTWPIKASALQVETVRSRALIDVQELFKQDLRSAIVEFASAS